MNSIIINDLPYSIILVFFLTETLFVILGCKQNDFGQIIWTDVHNEGSPFEYKRDAPSATSLKMPTIDFHQVL